MLQIVLLLSAVSFAEEDPCKEYTAYEKEMLSVVEKNLKSHASKIAKDLENPKTKAEPTQVESLETYQQELDKFTSAQDSAAKLAVLKTPDFKKASEGLEAKYQVQSKQLKTACNSWTKFQQAKRDGKCQVPDLFVETPFQLNNEVCTDSTSGKAVPGEVSSPKKPLKDSGKEKKFDTKRKIKKNPALKKEKKVTESSSGGGLVGIILSAIVLLLAGVVGLLGRKKVNTLQQKLEMAEQKISKLERKLELAGKQRQTTERNHLAIEEKYRDMSNQLKQVTDKLRDQSGVSQNQQVSSSQSQVEQTDPVADMGTEVVERPKKSGGLKLGAKGVKKEKSTEAPVSQMVQAFDGFLKIWTDNATVCQKLPGYQRFQTRLIQNADQYRTQLNVASFSEEEADSIILPMLDLMVRFESELTHISLQLSGRFNNEVQLVHNIIYQGFGGELERNRIGKLKEVRPMFDNVDTAFQSVIDSRSVAAQFKGKVVEIWKVGMINMSGMKLLRRAEVISGG